MKTLTITAAKALAPALAVGLPAPKWPAISATIYVDGGQVRALHPHTPSVRGYTSIEAAVAALAPEVGNLVLSADGEQGVDWDWRHDIHVGRGKDGRLLRGTQQALVVVRDMIDQVPAGTVQFPGSADYR